MKRISTEARLLDWIDTAPIEVVSSIMSIATQRLKKRALTEKVLTASQPLINKHVRKQLKKKTNAHEPVAASAATAFPGAGVTGASA